jgi:hypothetical protein
MAVKDDLRTQKATIWWRWWDEAEHKSSPEKRLAFYDALMRYIFRGDIPPDPTEMEDPTGIDYAAYDATHYFDVIDSNIETPELKRGGQPGNQNARKIKDSHPTEEVERIKTNPKTNKNESKNESQNEKTNPLRMKNEERRKKNEEDIDIARSRDRAPSPEEERFEKFWSAYPANCPRKADKKRCREKWKTIMAHADDPEATFNAIMAGLGRWKASEMWSEGDGQFIRAPLVWLNNANWEEEPKPAGQPEAEDEAAAAQRRFREEEERQKAILRAKGLMP